MTMAMTGAVSGSRVHDTALAGPQGKKPGKVKLLVSGHTPQVRQAHGTVTLTLPSILDHEVVAIDL